VATANARIDAWARYAASIVVVVLCMTACGGGAPAGTSPTDGTTNTSTTPLVSPSASTSLIRGCVPECSAGFSDPGSIGPGPYTTAIFLDGQLTVDYETRWVSHEDQGVEFSSGPAGDRQERRVLFWVDILPWDPAGHVASGVPNTAAGWVDWFRSNPIVSVTPPRHAIITKMRLPATYLDIAIAPDGGEKFPDLITWPNAGDNVYGIGGDFVFRLYLSDITYDGTDHLLAVSVEATNAASLDAFLPVAKQVIASAHAPIEAASG
jgi:hypothetical protein